MNRIVISFCLFAYALSGHTKDLTFSCVGTIEDDFTFKTKQPSHYETKDKIGLIVKEKQIVLVGSQRLEVPIQYERSGKSNLNFDFAFPICMNTNYEIFANNYSCDFNIIKNSEKNLLYKMANNFEIKFNGLTNVLSVLLEPTTEKRMQGGAYKMQHATYQCKAASSSF